MHFDVNLQPLNIGDPVFIIGVATSAHYELLGRPATVSAFDVPCLGTNGAIVIEQVLVELEEPIQDQTQWGFRGRELMKLKPDAGVDHATKYEAHESPLEVSQTAEA